MSKHSLITTLGRSQHLLILAPITLLCPRWYVRELFHIVRERHLQWGTKQACVTISFDCDFQEDIEALPQVLEMLAPYPYITSFACIGTWIERYPEPHRALVESGHEIVNHTYSHPNNEELGMSAKFNELSASEQEDEIRRCHEVCQSLLHIEPTGFRIPHFGALYTPTIYPILRKIGYRYSSSTVAARTPTAGAPFQERDDIVEFPVSPCPEHPFGILDTHHAFRKKHAWHRKPGKFFQLFQEVIEYGLAAHAHLNFYFDPCDVVQYDDFQQIFALLDECQDRLHVLTYAQALDQFPQNLERDA